MQRLIHKHWQRLIARFPQWEQAQAPFAKAMQLLAECTARQRKILICGNGGSAAAAEHIVDELMKSFILNRSLPQGFLRRLADAYPAHIEELSALQGGIAAISLVSGVALPTAFANDVNGDLSFAQQVYALANPGDIVLGISTSGNSANVNHALRVARLLSCTTIGLTGCDGGEMAELLDAELRYPSDIAAHVQELHLPMYHTLCTCLKEYVFGNQPAAAPAVPLCTTHDISHSPLRRPGIKANMPPRVDLLIFDFDGVFTDNIVRVDQHGHEAVYCSRSDSLGVDMLRAAHIPMLILSTETSPVVRARADKMRIPVEQGCGDKAAFLAAFMREHTLTPHNVIYMGNDVNDLAAMRLAGYVAAPRDAHPAVLKIAHIVTAAPGGKGAVREICDRILAAHACHARQRSI